MSGNVVAFPIPGVRRLTDTEVDRINRIRLGHDYNFAPLAPQMFAGVVERERWSLAKFLDEAEFPFAGLDAVDRRGIESLDIGCFCADVNLERVHVPGELSAVTTAKVIAYLLDIVECEFNRRTVDQGWLTSVSEVAGDALIRSIRGRAREWRKQGIRDEINLYHHFVCAERNPVVRRGVENAVINRWGWSGAK